jgi:hypothetical protein
MLSIVRGFFPGGDLVSLYVTNSTQQGDRLYGRLDSAMRSTGIRVAF